MAEVPFRQLNSCQGQLVAAATGNQKKLPPQPQRQLLSCTKCRERKVKCDRTKPCSACCARGLPRDCHFIAEDGNYAPIQQSYELRRLRAENLKLKQRFCELGIPIRDQDPDQTIPVDSSAASRLNPAQKWRPWKHNRFQETGWQDSIYFGAPSLATVISDFASVNINHPETLTHITPHSIDLFTSEIAPEYAFATLFSASPDECIPQLLSCLPTITDIWHRLDAFEQRASVEMAAELSRAEVERFLSDARGNSQSCPSMLALLFAIVALGAQQAMWNKNGGCDAVKTEAEAQKGNVYIAAAMQALRLDSFLHKPSLTAVQTLILIGKYLTDSGRFLDAFVLFGTTIRLAHSIGLHCHAKYLKEPPLTQAEAVKRQRIWWHMLRIDEEYSMTFGRPLGISSIGICCPPQELRTDPNILRLREFTMKFTLLARQILSSNRLIDCRIDDFTDALRALLDTIPEALQLDATWEMSEGGLSHDLWPFKAMAAAYHSKTHTYIVLLNRQRTQDEPPSKPYTTRNKALSPRPVNSSPSNASPPTPSTEPCLRGRAAVIKSSTHILSAFAFLHQRNPSILLDWSISQQAFNSCILLLLDAIEHRRVTDGVLSAGQGLQIFRDLQNNHVHKLARYAVDKISRALRKLHDVVAQSPYNMDVHQELPGIRQNGAATQVLVGVESVMGHTRMQLLEECGTQAVAQEAFAPINWGAVGVEVDL